MNSDNEQISQNTERFSRDSEAGDGEDVGSCGENASHFSPYAYLTRNEFTSEKFKIEIRNLPKYYGVKELKKLLNEKLNLNVVKIKLPRQKSSRIYVCFKTAEDRLHALGVLKGFKWKGYCLSANEAKPVPDPLIQKRIISSNMLQNENVATMKTDVKTMSDAVRDATTPFWRIPYDAQVNYHTCLLSDNHYRSLPFQLEKKYKSIIAIMKEYGKKLVQSNAEVVCWSKNQKAKFNGLLCEILPIRSSKVIDGYRNKCEFSIGINDVTGEKTVGFRLGSYVQGSVAVAPVDEASNVPDRMKVAVEVFQRFIRNSKYDVFHAELQKGVWKQFTARLGFRTNELMLVIGLDPQQMSPGELSVLKDSVREYFTNGEGSQCKVDSLYLQQIKKKRSQNEEIVYHHLLGKTHITETLLGKSFRISPQAFFQVNTDAAEILYESVAELAGLTDNVTLLDVCCGTGTIGICLSQRCGEVLGVEKSTEAIADAKANAEFNNINNITFYEGRAEDILACVAHKAKKEEIVAVVDPPRAGLERNALIHIRKNEKIKKLVYISCDPKKAAKNFLDLGRAASKIYHGEPFLPVKGIPVDLFPQTAHCELVIYFKRQ